MERNSARPTQQKSKIGSGFHVGQRHSLGNELFVTDGKVFFFALIGTEARRQGIQGFRLIPLIYDEQRVPDFRTGLAQFDHQAPSLRLALLLTANSAQKLHHGSLLSLNV